MNVDKLIVITDIKNDISTTILMENILNNVVDINILDFINKLKKQKIYHQYTNKKDLTDVLIKYLTPLNEDNDTPISQMIFIYYTGHIDDKSILLPYTNYGNNKSITYINSIIESDSILPLLDFRDIILKTVSPKSQILMLMDCCSPYSMELPYICKDGVYRLSKSPLIFPTPEIILIFSTKSKHRSVALDDGSVFSRFFFLELYGSSHNLCVILKSVEAKCLLYNHSHLSMVYSSYPNLKSLWMWVYTSTRNCIQIDYCLSLLTFWKK